MKTKAVETERRIFHTEEEKGRDLEMTESGMQDASAASATQQCGLPTREIPVRREREGRERGGRGARDNENDASKKDDDQRDDVNSTTLLARRRSSNAKKRVVSCFAIRDVVDATR